MPLAICATPIGNLRDVTLRVLDELRAAALVLCEDTRHTRKLLEHHGIRARLRSYHEHNEAKRTAEVLPRLESGDRVALVADAGMPGISDPGARLVGAALAAGVEVHVLPGPSAVETALVASGFGAERFRFVGFLPRGAPALDGLWAELEDSEPVVAFESPQRLPATLQSLAARQPDRGVAVCRELTKRFEEIVRGTAATLAERFAESPKGEITLVLDRREAVASGGSRHESQSLAVVRELVDAGLPRRRAAELVSRLTGISRNELYRRTL